jgi:hypothetical protein
VRVVLHRAEEQDRRTRGQSPEPLSLNSMSCRAAHRG